MTNLKYYETVKGRGSKPCHISMLRHYRGPPPANSIPADLHGNRREVQSTRLRFGRAKLLLATVA